MMEVMMNVFIGTIATLLSFTGFAIIPQFVVNSKWVKTDRQVDWGAGAVWVITITGLLIVGIKTQNPAWVVGLIIGFLITAGLALYFIKANS